MTVFAAENDLRVPTMPIWRFTMTGSVHHTDVTREYAYDRDSKFGRLDQALDEANARGWTVVDMKTDWKVIFPFEKK